MPEIQWKNFKDELPDLSRDYYLRRSNGDVYHVDRESEAKYRALYGPKTCGQWSYKRPAGEVYGEPV